jgi:ankyrin repeat protein
VRLLLDHGVDVNTEWGDYGTALYAASKEGHEEIVRLLLTRNADVNKGGYDRTALDAASFGGHENIVRLLLANGAEIELEYERSALVWASAGGHQEIVSLLLNKGADINAQGKFKQLDIRTSGR